jgi:pyruvate formate lyase activating enzyme
MCMAEDAVGIRGACPQLAGPLITEVKRHSLEDGPGIRSVVFFKGCPLRCLFCQNPQTQRAEAEIAVFAEACVGCGACAAACPRDAVDLARPGRIHRDRCDACGECVTVCPGRGLRIVGARHSPEALAAVLLRDLAYYRHSGGGVTLSGGEPTFFPDFLEALLGHLAPHGVHVALQTCGEFDYEVFSRKILPGLDLIYYDLKIADPVNHRKVTGKGNDRILSNFRRLVAEARVPVHARIPLVPGLTGDRANLEALVGILREAGARDVTLLPYNPLGLGMAERLGRPRPALPGAFMEPGEERAAYALLERLVQAPESSRPALADSVGPSWIRVRGG